MTSCTGIFLHSFNENFFPSRGFISEEIHNQWLQYVALRLLKKKFGTDPFTHQGV